MKVERTLDRPIIAVCTLVAPSGTFTYRPIQFGARNKHCEKSSGVFRWPPRKLFMGTKARMKDDLNRRRKKLPLALATHCISMNLGLRVPRIRLRWRFSRTYCKIILWRYHMLLAHDSEHNARIASAQNSSYVQ